MSGLAHLVSSARATSSRPARGPERGAKLAAEGRQHRDRHQREPGRDQQHGRPQRVEHHRGDALVAVRGERRLRGHPADDAEEARGRGARVTTRSQARTRPAGGGRSRGPRGCARPRGRCGQQPQNTTSTCRNPAISSTPSSGRLRKYRSRTSEVIVPARTSVASPPRKRRRLRRPADHRPRALRASSMPRLPSGPVRASHVSHAARDSCARLLDLLLGRVHHRHADLGEALERPLLEGLGVLPLLVLEARLLEGVEHDLLEVLGQPVPRLLVGDEPLAGGAGEEPVVDDLGDLEELHRLGVGGGGDGPVHRLLLERGVELAERRC